MRQIKFFESFLILFIFFLISSLALTGIYIPLGSHVQPTTASLTFIHTITITASQNIKVYMEVQEHELAKKQNEKPKIDQKRNEQLKKL